MKAWRTLLPRYLSVWFVLSAVFISVPFTTSAEQVSKQVGGAGFELSADQGTISLKATNAPLKVILDQIGEDLNIQVDAQVADDDTVTDEFQDLLVEEALRRLAPNYAIITGKDDKKITKIVILPKGEVAPAMPLEKDVVITSGSQKRRIDDSRESERSEPFKFEFDPSAVMSTE
jgi:hypothetical protein